nr:retrotransposable element Tf2 [Tanacetum cinerariifolium]
LGGLSKVEVVNRTLMAREEAIQTVKFHLVRAQNRMKQQADNGRQLQEILVVYPIIHFGTYQAASTRNTEDDCVSTGLIHMHNTAAIPISEPLEVTDEAKKSTASPDVGNTPVNEFPTSYATKVSPTSVTMANIQKLEANVPNDADYDIWLPLASVHKINDRMTNSLYEYFIVKWLAFPFVEWFMRNN